MICEDTVLFPEGGGQNSDHGELAGRKVLQVLADDDMIMMIMIMVKEEYITPTMARWRGGKCSRKWLMMMVDHSLVMVMILIMIMKADATFTITLISVVLMTMIPIRWTGKGTRQFTL